MRLSFRGRAHPEVTLEKKTEKISGLVNILSLSCQGYLFPQRKLEINEGVDYLLSSWPYIGRLSGKDLFSFASTFNLSINLIVRQEKLR